MKGKQKALQTIQTIQTIVFVLVLVLFCMFWALGLNQTIETLDWFLFLSNWPVVLVVLVLASRLYQSD